MRHFHKQTPISAPAAEVFAWHEQPEALDKLNPPWEDVKVVSKTGPVSQDGSQVTLSIPLIPVPGLSFIRMNWVSEHSDYIAGVQFKDTQISGPFWHWVHTHSVIDTENGCLLDDNIEFEVPFGSLGWLFAGWFIQGKLQKMFDYRHQVVLDEFSK